MFIYFKIDYDRSYYIDAEMLLVKLIPGRPIPKLE